MTDAEQIAQFLATRGATKISAGESTLGHMTARDWRAAHRHPGGVSGLRAEQENALIDQRIVRGNVIYNGLGEVIAIEGSY